MEKKKTLLTLAPDVRAALETLLPYLWEDEKRNFAEQPGPLHIFPKLQRIREWIEERED